MYRTAFFGSPKFAATILNALAGTPFAPSLVITEPAKPVGRKHILTQTAVEQCARELQLHIATPRTKAELVSLLPLGAFDLILVAAYGKILPATVLEAATFGAINVHASLLPRWRGASPIQAAILAGDKKTGISFMRMEEGLDTGPVIDQHEIIINPYDTTATLTEKLATTASSTIIETLSDYILNKKTPTKQPSDGTTYAPKIRKEDGRVKLETCTPELLDRLVRAYTPWPGVYTNEFDRRLIIRAGRLEGDAYHITKLQWEGKSPIDDKVFAQAYPKILTSLPKTVKVGDSDSPHERR